MSIYQDRYAELDEEFHEEWHASHGGSFCSMLIRKLIAAENRIVELDMQVKNSENYNPKNCNAKLSICNHVVDKGMVYIASPYTLGDVAVNVRESFLVADQLINYGFTPFPPLFSHFWHFLSPKDYDEWMKLDKQYLLRCDYLLRLPGKSSGADEEVKFAKEHGIQVFYSIYDLLRYCEEQIDE